MSLFVETTGTGPDLVLLHGWGLHGGLFAPLVERLSPRFRIHAVDLPGHGRSRVAAQGLAEWADVVRASVPQGAIWLGWSLGGLLALRQALDHPREVRALVLVATTPRFTTTADWPHAQAPEVLARFATGIESDFRKTVLDFLTLQSLGSEHARELVRDLRATVFAHGDPEPHGLSAGLDILRDADLRAELSSVSVPTLVVAGARDRLTPPQAARAVADAVTDAQLDILPRSAHTPFLSEPDWFAERVARFVDAA